MRFSLKPGKHRVNLVIKDHVIRFSYTNSPAELDDLDYFGVQTLPKGVIKEGKILDSQTLMSIIEQLVDTYNWKKDKLYFCLPDASVVIRTYQIPVDIEKDEIKGYLYMKLGDDLHLPFDDPIFDYQFLHKDENMNHILLFAYPEQQIRIYESIFEETKLRAKVADLSSLSIYRLYNQSNPNKEDEHLLSLQWNVDGCVLTVFRKGRPEFIRHMKNPLDIESFKKATVDSFRFEWYGPQEDLNAYIQDQLMEVQRVMDFYRYSVMKGDAGITKILLSGDFSELTYVYSECTERFSIPIELLRLHDIHTKSGERLPDQFAEVAGLSLKE
ncbi:type IV pilus biogenesis protein PilM [Pontibacillus yanchengensis]|uniref:Pilus assembly protein PilM n=1 Tax=Pontibacillus yanchengensis Y32 TaxID=1385514 RepID=A0A0A2TEG5_9BACI|nr:pilus assembly protein PilM [Pontibacillus yanchengensis]KGP73924.1 hypothetical protein N782_21245 [Pontibacillus yanchengensis Y32]